MFKCFLNFNKFLSRYPVKLNISTFTFNIWYTYLSMYYLLIITVTMYQLLYYEKI